MRSNSVGLDIREERRRQQLTQKELAARSGVTQVTVSAVELGTRGKRETIEKLAKALGLRVEVTVR